MYEGLLDSDGKWYETVNNDPKKFSFNKYNKNLENLDNPRHF